MLKPKAAPTATSKTSKANIDDRREQHRAEKEAKPAGRGHPHAFGDTGLHLEDGVEAGAGPAGKGLQRQDPGEELVDGRGCLVAAQRQMVEQRGKQDEVKIGVEKPTNSQTGLRTICRP